MCVGHGGLHHRNIRQAVGSSKSHKKYPASGLCITRQPDYIIVPFNLTKHLSQQHHLLRLHEVTCDEAVEIDTAGYYPTSVVLCSPANLVGSRTGAVLLRYGLSIFSPFPLGVPH